MDKLKQLRQQLDAALALMEQHRDKGGKAFDDAKADAERLKGEIKDEEQRQADEAQRRSGQPGNPPADANAAAAAAAAERTRMLDIDKLCRAHKVKDADRDAWLKDGKMTVDQVRAKILDGLAGQSDEQQERSQIRVLRDAGDTMREGMVEALQHRYQPVLHPLTDKGRQYRGLRLLEMAKEYLQSQGISTRGLVPMEVAALALGNTRAAGYMGTSDFPLLLANVANKSLRQAYDMAPSTWKLYTRTTTAPDFKQMSRLQLGEAPKLVAVSASGEFEVGGLGEAKEVYAISTFGRIVAINRQVLVNDDLGAFTRVPELMGRAAADLITDTVVAILTANANMGDGTPLFHADHGNLAGAAAISVTTIDAMRKAMRTQTGLDKKTIINVQPKFLIVPAAMETVAEQFCALPLVAAKSSDTNPFVGKLQPLVEPKLDANSTAKWYGAADPASIDTIEVAFLEGQVGPYTETRMGFEVDGVELKIRQDVGAKAIDWRGLYRNG